MTRYKRLEDTIRKRINSKAHSTHLFEEAFKGDKVQKPKLSWNPFSFLEELKNLIKKMVEFYPRNELNKLTLVRTRPRCKGKPL